MESEYPPWNVTETAPAWVVAVIKEEHWPESAVAHLLKRLVSEGVEHVRFGVRPDGVSTVELVSATGEWPTPETLQELDAQSSRPVDEAIKRALEVIARKRAAPS